VYGHTPKTFTVHNKEGGKGRIDRDQRKDRKKTAETLRRKKKIKTPSKALRHIRKETELKFFFTQF